MNPVYDVLVGPNGENLPISYRWLIAQRITRLCPWDIWTGKEFQEAASSRRAEFIKETSSPNSSKIKDMFPFASAQHMDDFAGFIIENGEITEKVVVVHLTWKGAPEAEGFPSMKIYRDIWHWLTEEVIPETSTWVCEEELLEIQEQEAGES